MDKIEKYELIERYLANEMADHEHRAFEDQLNDNKALFDEFLIHKELDSLLSNEDLHKFLDTVHQTDARWTRPSKKNNTSFIQLNARLILGIAASLLIVIFSWQFLFVSGDSSSSSQLFADYYEPYQIVLSQRSESQSSGHVALFNQAIQDYADGDYTSAADAFRQLQTMETENVSYKFYFAVSLLSSDNAPEAIDILEELLETPNHFFTEQSRWYLAMAYISTNDRNSAVEVLQSISPGQFQYTKSRDIITELE